MPIADGLFLAMVRVMKVVITMKVQEGQANRGIVFCDLNRQLVKLMLYLRSKIMEKH